MAYRDFDNYYTPGYPREWKPEDWQNKLSGTTRLFSRRVWYYVNHPDEYTIAYNNRDENYKKWE